MNKKVFSITQKQSDLIGRRMEVELCLSIVYKLAAKYGINSSLPEIKAKLEGEIIDINHSLINDGQEDKQED